MECGEQCLPGIPHQALSTAITHEGQVKSRCSLNGEAGMGDLSESASPRFALSWRMGRAPRFRSDYLDAQVADSVAQQMLEVLVASRFSEDRADEQMLDPGGAKVEGEEGMQLVPRIRRAGVPIRVAEHAEEHRELAEQGNTGIGQRCFVSVAGHVVGHVLPRLRLVHLPAHSLAVATGLQDNACRLEPRFVGWDPRRGHSEVAGVAEIGAEGLLGTSGQIVLFDGGQVEDGLSPSPAAGWAEGGSGPGVDVSPPDSEINGGQPPYGDEDSNQSRITHHTAHQVRDPGGVRQTPGQVAGGEKLPAAIVELLSLDGCLIGPTASHEAPRKGVITL